MPSNKLGIGRRFSADSSGSSLWSSAAVVLVLALVCMAAACAGEESATSVTVFQTTPTSVIQPMEDLPLPQLGATEVGTITNLPTIDFDWTFTELTVADGDSADALLNHVGFHDDDYIAVAFAWHAPPDNQTVYTWRSADGVEWSATQQVMPQGESMFSLVDTGGDLIGLGNKTVDGKTLPQIWLADTEGGWDPMDYSTSETGSSLDLTNVHLVGAAKTEAGYLFGATFDKWESDSPVAFEVQGLRFELDDYEGLYRLVEIETGRLVTSGRWADLYSWSDDGQAIYDPQTGQLITTVPWEVWDGIYPRFSPLPIPVASDEDWQAPHTIEWDGMKITVNEGDDHFEVSVDGTLVAQGRMQNLWRGPAPSFVDSATGEIAISFEWDEWDALTNAAYENHYQDEHVTHESQQLAIFTPDGKTWSRKTLAENANTHLESILSVGDTFIVGLVEHLEYATDRQIFTSEDGTTWTEHESSGPEYTDQLRAGSSGLIGISFEEQHTVTTSDDGINWIGSLSLGPQDDDRHGWLHAVNSGEFGLAAIGTLAEERPYEVLSITVGDRTAEFGGPNWAVRVTDAVGEVLLEVDWFEMEEESSQGSDRFAFYEYDETGKTSLFDGEGGLLMVITDQQAEEAMSLQNDMSDEGLDHVMFLRFDNQWHEANLADDHTPEIVAVGADAILVGTIDYEQYSGYEHFESAPTRLGVLVGIPTNR